MVLFGAIGIIVQELTMYLRPSIIVPSSYRDINDEPSVQIVSNKTLEDSIVSSFNATKTFHIPAYNQLKRLINESTIISWGEKKAKGFDSELRIKFLLSQQLSIVRSHELSTKEKLSTWANTSNDFIWVSNICDAIRCFEQTGSINEHVLFTRCNENFGDFSRHVPEKKSADWDHRVLWKSNGCTSDEDVYRYLNHTNTQAIFTTQHHFLDHPKVHSLPLGIKHTMRSSVLKMLQQPFVEKSKLLMINDNGWKHRKNVTKAVIQNFARYNLTLQNTYSNRNAQQYLVELRQSKFILAPSGLGWDCYRIWEALHFNTIPIVERYYRPHDGWRRTLDGLPVLWVEDFRNLTPSLLRDEYQRIASRASNYQYEKLTWQWWADFALSFTKHKKI